MHNELYLSIRVAGYPVLKSAIPFSHHGSCFASFFALKLEQIDSFLYHPSHSGDILLYVFVHCRSSYIGRKLLHWNHWTNFNKNLASLGKRKYKLWKSWPLPFWGLKGGAKTITINAIYKIILFLLLDIKQSNYCHDCNKHWSLYIHCEIYGPRVRSSGAGVVL